MDPEAKLVELGLELPPTPPAAGNYLPYVQVGNVLHLSGTISMRGGEMTHVGQVGVEQTVESGYESARVCALNALANIKVAVGSLSKIRRIVYVGGYVNAVSGFEGSPAVINGASDLFVGALGEAGRHARAAVAVAGLPKNSTVEIQVVAEIEA